jgi:hypothetical protein
MDCRAFAAPKGLRPRRRVKPGNDEFRLQHLPPQKVEAAVPERPQPHFVGSRYLL